MSEGIGKTLLRKFKAIDIFWEEYTLKIDRDTDEVRSVKGSCCTIAVVFVILIYAMQRMEKFLIE